MPVPPGVQRRHFVASGNTRLAARIRRFYVPHAGLKDTISESNTECPPGARGEPRHTAVDDVQAGARGQGERPRAERSFWHLAKVIAGV